MRTIDYNGTGEWSREAILARYIRFAKERGITPRDLRPRETASGDVQWVYPVMDQVIDGIVTGDEACKELGIEFVEQDATFPFGRILKASTARALRRTTLRPEQQDRLRRRFVTMLLRGKAPREFKEYAKLLKRIGLGDWRTHLDEGIDRQNPYVMHWYRNLTGSR